MNEENIYIRMAILDRFAWKYKQYYDIIRDQSAIMRCILIITE